MIVRRLPRSAQRAIGMPAKVEERERSPPASHDGVGQAELRLDRADEDREQLAVDEVDDVDDEEVAST
jgi:hypothetical protein